MPPLRQTHAAVATATATAAAAVARVARVTHLYIAGISRFLAGGSTAQPRETAVCTTSIRSPCSQTKRDGGDGSWPLHDRRVHPVQRRALGRRTDPLRDTPVFPNFASVAIYF